MPNRNKPVSSSSKSKTKPEIENAEDVEDEEVDTNTEETSSAKDPLQDNIDDNLTNTQDSVFAPPIDKETIVPRPVDMQDKKETLKLSNSRVDPTQDKFASHKGKKKSGPPDNAVIRSINGRELVICDGNDCESKDQDCVVTIAKKAEVYLNGEKMTLAALDNGDKVVLSKGGKEQADHPFEYKRVDATRDNTVRE